MQIIKLSQPINIEVCANVCGTGYFDGVHLGHQKLIKTVIEDAKKIGVKSAIFTFDKSIDLILGKEFKGEITPLEHRLKIFEELGLDYCFVFEFNINIASMDPEDFIKGVLMKLNTKEIVCGSDFHFGYKGLGNCDLLQRYIKTNVIDFLKFDDESLKVSSSIILKKIQEGSIETVNKMLGREFFIKGEVLHGLGNGKKIGFPTANIDYSSFILPHKGVYLVEIKVKGQKYTGLANIGTHPTIDELEKAALEVFIYDFDEDIYGEIATVFFKKFVRDESNFGDIENLKNQVKKDTFFNF